MASQEFEITIDPTGEVRVHMRGVKGKHCVEYAKWLAELLGREKSREMTAEHYEPEGVVRIDVDQGQGR